MHGDPIIPHQHSIVSPPPSNLVFRFIHMVSEEHFHLNQIYTCVLVSTSIFPVNRRDPYTNRTHDYQYKITSRPDDRLLF